MAFKKTGTPEKIIGIVGYDPKKAKAEKCPHCGEKVGTNNNGIKKVGKLMVIGKAILKCPGCGKEIQI